MLVPSRKSQEAVVVGGIRAVGRKPVVTIVENQGGEVRPGFVIDSDVPVQSEEDWERIRAAAGETC
jgi:sRNA-binding carbon storage regulator CsrA